VDALPIDAAAASDALLRLSNLHIVELAGNLFIVSPPLRIAVERDKARCYARERSNRGLESGRQEHLRLDSTKGALDST